MSTVEKLQRMAIFGHFGPAQLELLAACVSPSRFPADAVVLKQGDQSLDAYAVESGHVRIQRETPYGLFALANLGPGDLFGEASFVDSSARSGDASTVKASVLLSMNPVALGAALERDPRFAVALYWSFWKSIAGKLRKTNAALARFFPHGPIPDAAVGERGTPATGEFRIDINAKRDLFAGQSLSSLEINFLTSLSKEKKLAPGEILFHEGEPGDRMYVVLDGRVMISKMIPGAGEEALAFLERGDYFGEMALIDQKPRSADAKAHAGGAVVLAIPKEVVEGLLDVRKVSSLRLLKILCRMIAKRLREIDDKLVGWYILAGGQGPEDL